MDKAPESADAISGQASGSTLREILTFAIVALIVAMLFFGYWTLHRQPDGGPPSQQQVDAEAKSNAMYAVKYCRERANELPAGLGEAKIAQEACELMQTQYEQTYRLTP